MKGVALFSGGIDSATVLAMALEECDSVIAVNCQYGSLHNAAELHASASVIDHYQLEGFEVRQVVITLPSVFGGGDSALMGDIPMPAQTYSEIHNAVGPSPTVVPFRNANLLAIATTLAVVEDAQVVYCGMHGEDAHNWAYPDCTPEFLGAMANAIRVGTYDKVRLKFPLIWLMKSDVVARAYDMGVPAQLTWSCYKPVEVEMPMNAFPFAGSGGTPVKENMHCGACPTCIERIEAFKSNNLIDPVDYAIPVEWDGCDPYN